MPVLRNKKYWNIKVLCLNATPEYVIIIIILTGIFSENPNPGELLCITLDSHIQICETGT